ncbi:MAG TPA: lytic transglycosylase domain-containing protein, partial [Geobacteraceae bacterium]
RGLMQFIPTTAKTVAGELGLVDFRQEMLFDPPTALRLGARYLRGLLDRFGGDVVCAVAAYNAGEVAVEQWRKRWGELPPAEFVETIPYRETRHYVKKVLTMLDAYGNVGKHGLWEEVSP